MGEAALAFPAGLADEPASRRQATIPDGVGDAYSHLRGRVANERQPCFWPALPPKAALSDLERTGLVRLAETISGGGDQAELLAMMEVMRTAPAGDVVQLGAGLGRSAALLVWLARRYRVGKLLCVDPWAAEMANDSDEALRIFQINLAPLALGDLNYIRASSRAAAGCYRPGLTVSTEAFGAVTYEGRIAVLHVGDDAAAWTPHVAPGGWIIFGEGPRAADAFIAANQGRIAARFRAGASLFIQLKR